MSQINATSKFEVANNPAGPYTTISQLPNPVCINDLAKVNFDLTPQLAALGIDKEAHFRWSSVTGATGCSVLKIDEVSITLTLPCNAYFQQYGTGCPGSGGCTPQLQGLFCPIPGADVELQISNVLGNAQGLLLIGLGQLQVPFKQCTLDIFPLFPVSLGLFVPGLGSCAGSLDIPATLPLDTPLNADVYFQLIAADPGAPAGVSISNALRMHIE